jgi:hypothetical protein
VGNTLFFGAVDDAHGRELWTSVAPPSVTVEQAVGQSEPVTGGPITFDVRFSLDVTGFDAADVDLSASTVGGTLTETVTQITPSTYTVQVNGMFGAGTVVATIRDAAAVDASGIPSVGSSSRDNSVAYNGAGTVGFTATAYDATEGTPLVVTSRRTGGSDGAVSISYHLDAGTAGPADYTDVAGTFDWADGETGDKSISIPITDDHKSEVAETFTAALTGPTGSAGAPLTGTLSAPITIARSNPLGSGTSFVDADGDTVTVTLAQPKNAPGTVAYYLNSGTGPIQTIELAGTDPLTSRLNLTLKKAKAPAQSDGLVTVGSVTGTGLKALNFAKAVLDGPGIHLTGMVQAVNLAAVRNGADIVAAGSAPKKATAITVTGSVGDGTLVQLDAPLGTFKAAGVGAGAFDVPSIGTMTIRGDFRSDVTASGAGVDPIKGKALAALTVTGAVTGSDIRVGGNVGAVSALAFVDSRLFAGYAGADDGSGLFSDAPATVASFRTRGADGSFRDSFVVASTVRTVSLRSVDVLEDGTKYGVYAHAVKVVTITSPAQKFHFDPKAPSPQGKFDFEVRVVV